MVNGPYKVRMTFESNRKMSTRDLQKQIILAFHSGRYARTNIGSCGPSSGLLSLIGRTRRVVLFPMSSAGTASWNSNARSSVKTATLILRDSVSSSHADEMGSILVQRVSEAQACVLSSHEGEIIRPYSRYIRDRVGEGIPAFWTITEVSKREEGGRVSRTGSRKHPLPITLCLGLSPSSG